MKKWITFLGLIFIISSMFAQEYQVLDINKVSAGYGNRGVQFWDFNGSPSYVVPKDAGANSSFSTGIWIGGLDPNSELHIAAPKFNLNAVTGNPGFDFYPGPLDTISGTTDSATVNQFNRFWNIDRFQIEQFKLNFSLGNVSNGTYTIPDVITNWPAHGTNNMTHNLAPFVDFEGDGHYNPLNGDYPKITGDQMLWWVFNDNFGTHEESKGKPMGIEVQSSAYAYKYDNPTADSLDMINYQTFQNYKITNRSDTIYHNVYVGIYSDMDLGAYFDDFVGCNVKLNSFYNYNANDNDGNGQLNAYGLNPPVQTYTVLKGPLSDINDGIDNDRDSIIDEAGETIGLSKFMVFHSQDPYDTVQATMYPIEAIDYYNYLSGKWKDGSNLLYGGTGHVSGTSTTSPECDFMFPGSSDANGWGTNGVSMVPWSEITSNLTPGDRAGVGSIGPFTLMPGESKTIDILYGWFRSFSYQSNLNTFGSKVSQIINWYNNNAIPSNYEMVLTSTNQNFNDNNLEFDVYPNPTKNQVNIKSSKNVKEGIITISDIQGKSLISKIIKDSNSNVDISELSNGIYILKIQTEFGLSVKQIVKQ